MPATTDLLLTTTEIAAGGAPEWVQLIPAGPDVPSNDGRRRRLSNPEAVVAAFAAYGHPIPVDVEHATHLRAPQGLDAPAYGWVREMAVRDGAVWGRVEWSETATRWIKEKAYKFLSAGYAVDAATSEITRILSVGFTNHPGFVMPELARQQAPKPKEENDTMDKAVLQALGLPETASAADAVVAIGKLKENVETARAATPDPDKWVPATQLETANAKIAEFEKVETARADAAIVALVDAGVTAGKIAPAAKDGYLEMARAVGAEKFAASLDKMPVIASGKTTIKDPGNPAPAGQLSAEEIEVARKMGIDQAEFLKTKTELEAN